ncbi:MAG TPA: guanylate kinase [Caulobacteraceae bacterium]|jgi:guanylate kinase|nr:guanylate kinase [Caulobacteraceae bacterium]
MSNRRGLLLVISSPSGAGKTSLAKRLTMEYPELGLSVSATTRAARPGESDGREYHFVSPASFETMVAQDAFLEWAEVHEHRYGSPRAPILERLAAGQDVLFDIDWQGARAIKAAAPDDTVSVFILPPTLAALEKRLRARAQDADRVIVRRLARAHGEIAMYANYEYVLVNDDFDAAYAKLAAIYVAERERRERNPWLDGFVARLLSES